MNYKLYRDTRKLIIALGICLGIYVLLVLCTSCSSGEIKDDGNNSIKVNTFMYNNHKYNKFTEPYQPYRMGIEHDPECLKKDLKIK